MSERVEMILRAFDGAWSHKWESLEYALKDLSEEEALWQHPSYSLVEIIEGEGLPGSVMWHIIHIEQCERQYADMLRERRIPLKPTIAHERSSDFQFMKQQLQQTHLDFRDAIAALNDEDLQHVYRKEKSGYDGMNMEAFMWSCIRHNSWHAGQIMVARRLYKESVQS